MYILCQYFDSDLPWQVKRLALVQLVQIVPGRSNSVIVVIHQHLWLT